MWCWAYWNSLGSSRVILRISAPWSPETVGADHWAEWFSLMVSTIHRTRNPTRNRALPCPDSQPGWQGRRCPSPGKGEVGLKNDEFIDQIFMCHCPLWNSSLLRAKLLLGYTEAKTYSCVHFHTTHTHTHTHSLKLCPQRHPSVFLWVTCSDKSYHMLKKISVECSS